MGYAWKKKKVNIRRRKLEVFVQNFKDIPIGKIYTKFFNSEYQKEKFRCVCTKF